MGREDYKIKRVEKRRDVEGPLNRWEIEYLLAEINDPTFSPTEIIISFSLFKDTLNFGNKKEFVIYNGDSSNISARFSFKMRDDTLIEVSRSLALDNVEYFIIE